MKRLILIVVCFVFVGSVFAVDDWTKNYKSYQHAYYNHTNEKIHASIAAFDSSCIVFKRQTQGEWDIEMYDSTGVLVFKVDTAGQVLTQKVILTDQTDTHFIKAVQEAGLGGRVSIGVDETARTMWVGDVGDIDTDHGLAASANPKIIIAGATPSNYSYWDLNHLGTTMGDWYFEKFGNGDFFFRQRTSDIDAGNLFNFYSDAGIEMTDTNGEQSWMYIEPKFNGANTSPFNSLQIKATETALGTGGHNLIKAGTTADDDIFQVDNSGQVKAGVVLVGLHTSVTTLSTAQVNALRATPISLVAAQGANTIIVVVEAIVTYDYASAAFTVGADEDLVIEYADGTDISGSIETTGFLDQGDDEVRYVPSALAVNADLEASINQAVQIFNSGSGETADGGGEVDIRLTYRVYATGF